jgi:hypothetical protein
MPFIPEDARLLCRVRSLIAMLTLEPLSQDVVDEFPGIADIFENFQKTFRTSLDVPGQTCVYIATGKAKHALKGKYFDCEQNIQTVVDHADEIKSHDLYELKVEFLGGLPNDGGTSKFQIGDTVV